MASELDNKIVTYLDDVVFASETVEEGGSLLKLLIDKQRVWSNVETMEMQICEM